MDYSLGIENFDIVILYARLIEHDVLNSAVPILLALHAPVEINEQFNDKPENGHYRHGL